MQNENKLQVKDLVMIGIFGVILFAVSIISMTLAGISPRLYPFESAVTALLSAPIYFLLVAKVNKPFTSFISFSIVGIVWIIMGGYTLGAGIIITALITELILRNGGYKSMKRLSISYLIIILGNYIGDLGVVYINTKAYIEMSLGGSASGVNEDYVLALVDSAKGIVGGIAFASCIVMAILGSLFARRLMKKHFIKAGIV
jgi:energy-coupling factor transport system substrate-specific component